MFSGRQDVMVHETGTASCCSLFSHSCRHWGHRWDHWTAASIRKSSVFQVLSCVCGKTKFLELISQWEKTSKHLVLTKNVCTQSRDKEKWMGANRAVNAGGALTALSFQQQGCVPIFWWWSVSGAWEIEGSICCQVKSSFVSLLHFLCLHQRMPLSYVAIN